jgi:hypothetical protein
MRPFLVTFVSQKAVSPAALLASGRHSTTGLSKTQEDFLVLILSVMIRLPTFFGCGLCSVTSIGQIFLTTTGLTCATELTTVTLTVWSLAVTVPGRWPG